MRLLAQAANFSHDGPAGPGDFRLTLNKAAPANTASILFQNGFPGRAELGLTGDDALALRTSEDGATFADAIRVSPTDRVLSLSTGLKFGKATP